MFSLVIKKWFQPFSFLKFSETLSLIQQTSSTVKKVQILSEYVYDLNEAEKLETKKLFDFVNKKIKTGVSDKLLITNCSKLLGGNIDEGFAPQNQNSDKDPIKKNKETVSIIEKFIPKDKISLNIEVQEINKVLENITKIEGKNSVQLKVNQVMDTLSNLSFVESKFFLRILTKDMKIGMKNKLVEKAFIQVQEKQSGSNLALNFRSFNPMLARPLRDVEEFQKFCAKKQGKIVADVKYDGQRTLITFEKGKDIVLISRNGKQQNQKYYKIAEDLQKMLQSHPDVKSITFDGQILAIDKLTKQPLPFQVLLTKRRKKEQSLQSILSLDDDPDVQQVIYLFDVLEYNGEKLYTTPLIERKKLIFENDLIKKGQFEVFSYPEQKDKLMGYFHAIIKRKYQGLILKGLEDHYYTNGSRIHWGKLKKGFREKKEDKGQIDLDLILMGADYGRGKKSKFFSSFLVGVKYGDKIVPISRVGSGFTDEELEGLTEQFSAKIIKNIDDRYNIPKNIRMDVWFKPQLVVEIDCQQFTRSPLYELGYKQNFGGISLRFPVFKRIRDDKNIQQATEAESILEEMEKQEHKMMERNQKKLDLVKQKEAQKSLL